MFLVWKESVTVTNKEIKTQRAPTPLDISTRVQVP